jgi:NAD+ kinase
MGKRRLDTLLAERGLFPSRSRAAASVMAGEVYLEPARSSERRAGKPGELVDTETHIRVVDGPAFVSRGGIKLANALLACGLDVRDRRALDVGASTGGFTDCLLQRGAREVIAVDVGYGILDYRLRTDPRVSVMERTNARSLTREALPAATLGPEAPPDLATVDVSFISLGKVLGALIGCLGEGYDLLALVKPQFELGRGRIGKGGVVRAADDRREALIGVGETALALGAAAVGYHSSGLPGPKGNRETFLWLTDPASARGTRDPQQLETMAREITVFTHRRPDDTREALELLAQRAAQAGVMLRLDESETRKLCLHARPGLMVDAPATDDVELCIVLGGDGTILRALRRYAGTGVPVFAINFGEIGFLATIEPEHIEDGIRRALTGDYELLRLPAITLELPTGKHAAINDVAIHRKVGERVAELAYALDGEEAGSVRCDGLVVATPAGSTGYNLANGGPVMAWGVAGFVVSFIAPHSMSARALVVAPDDRMTIYNRSREPLDVAVDGRPAGEIPPAGMIEAQFVNDVGTIAQLPGSSFYRRLREKFGRLAS